MLTPIGYSSLKSDAGAFGVYLQGLQRFLDIFNIPSFAYDVGDSQSALQTRLAGDSKYEIVELFIRVLASTAILVPDSYLRILRVFDEDMYKSVCKDKRGTCQLLGALSLSQLQNHLSSASAAFAQTLTSHPASLVSSPLVSDAISDDQDDCEDGSDGDAEDDGDADGDGETGEDGETEEDGEMDVVDGIRELTPVRELIS